MARFYSIELTPNPGVQTAPNTSAQTWTSYPNGANDPGALNVQLDLTVAPFAAVGGQNGAVVTIDGIALPDLFQAQKYTGMNIAVQGGMKAGLPLANAGQSGLLIQGQIYQAYGNWVGVDQNLNFVIVAGSYTYNRPGNFSFQWSPGQPLSQAIAAMLSPVYPSATPTFAISPNYSTSATITHAVNTLQQMAQFIKSLTTNDSFPGVDISVLSQGTILVFDGTVQTPPIVPAFTDLIGQPRWTEPNVMQFQTVMRADIQVGSFVMMPKGLQNVPGIVGVNASANPSQLKYTTSFQGQFLIRSVRHVGAFRDPDGTSWTTIFQAVPLTPGAPF